MEKVKLSPPWITFVHELIALFGQDPEIKIEYDEDESKVTLYVEDQNKADALVALLPGSKVFGNVTLNINVVPANVAEDYSSVFETAFKGNPVLSNVVCATTPLGNINYVVFKKEVVQYYNDQMDDLYGNKSTLYQDIAKDVFCTVPGVYYCTDNK